MALARAQARCGVIPAEAAEEIAARSKVEALDFDLLRQETDIVGYPILPLVHQLVKMCGEAGRYVHWGATTQDIMDTAVVLQVRDGPGGGRGGHHRPAATSSPSLAQRHRDTLMAGRTHLQQALPMTFGYKVAVWLAMFDRHAERLEQLPPAGAGRAVRRCGRHPRLPGRPGARGAAGADGGARPRRAGGDLACRPRRVRGEPSTCSGLITGSLGKIAYDVMLMASTEFGELYEPFVTGRGASSTMPQKRNPISSELMLAAAKAVRQHAGLMLDAMIQDFERATGPWHAEWIAIPESFVLTAGALHQAKFMLDGLIVDERADAQEPRSHRGAHRRRGGDDGAGARTSAASRRTTSSTPPAAPSTSRVARWPRSWRPSRKCPAISTVPPSSG